MKGHGTVAPCAAAVHPNECARVSLLDEVATLRAQLAAAELERDRWRQSERIAVVKLDAAAHRVRALEGAIDKARRETASDPDNRWCRNATVILNAALALRAPRETGG